MSPLRAIADQRIKRIMEENARLKAEDTRLLEKYIIW